jgi:hypothetical protein
MDTRKKTVEQRELQVVVQGVEVQVEDNTGMDIDKTEDESIEVEVLEVAVAAADRRMQGQPEGACCTEMRSRNLHRQGWHE